MAEQLSRTDRALRASRRQLFAVCGVLVVLGAGALIGFGPGTLTTQRHAVWLMLPVLVCVLVAVLHGMGRDIDQRSREMLQDDELRQASLQRAMRNGFFAMLGLQPVAALAMVSLSLEHQSALMATITVVAGSLTVLASLLWYDR